MSHDVLQRIIGVGQLVGGAFGEIYGGAYGAGSGAGNMMGQGIANIQGKDTDNWWKRKGGFGQDVLSSFGLGSMDKNYDPNTPQNKYGAIGQGIGGIVGGLSGSMGGGGGGGAGDSFTAGNLGYTINPGQDPNALVLTASPSAAGGAGGGMGGLGGILGGLGGGGGGMGNAGGIANILRIAGPLLQAQAQARQQQQPTPQSAMMPNFPQVNRQPQSPGQMTVPQLGSSVNLANMGTPLARYRALIGGGS